MAASQNVALVCLLKLFSDNDEYDSGNLYRMHSDGMEADEEVLITAASAAAVMPSSDERIQGCVPNFFEEYIETLTINYLKCGAAGGQIPRRGPQRRNIILHSRSPVESACTHKESCSTCLKFTAS